MSGSFIKEGILVLLLLSITIFINQVIFYDLLPNNNESILHKVYSESPELKEVLAKVGELNVTDNSKKGSGEVIDKESVTLSPEEKIANEKHSTGKKNPFDNYFSAESEIETKEEKPKEQSEGTFFEKKDKK